MGDIAFFKSTERQESDCYSYPFKQLFDLRYAEQYSSGLMHQNYKSISNGSSSLVIINILFAGEICAELI